MKRFSFFAVMAALFSSIPISRGQEKLPLWPDDTAGQAFVTVHRAGKEDAPAVVICPGGGYAKLVTEGEGHGIARWLNGHGITGIVLEYRLPQGRSGVPLQDAQRAIRLTRMKSGEWGIDPHKVGIIGFSAGGHLASTAGTHFDGGKPDATDPMDRVSCRPDFMIVVYPVITMDVITHGGSKKNLLGESPSEELIRNFSNDLQVTEKTPPAFITHALDDKTVPYEHSVRFYKALQAHKVKSELLELPTGGHGLNGYKGPMWDRWQQRSMEWLGEIGITAAP